MTWQRLELQLNQAAVIPAKAGISEIRNARLGCDGFCLYPCRMKFCWANTLFILVIITLGTLSVLSACGQKGDLYLPEKDRPAEKK